MAKRLKQQDPNMVEELDEDAQKELDDYKARERAAANLNRMNKEEVLAGIKRALN